MARNSNIVKLNDLAKKMAEKFNLTKKDATDILGFLVSQITDALKSGQQVKLAGLGTFKVRERKARVAINPKTGEKVNVPATRVPKITPAKDLKEAVK